MAQIIGSITELFIKRTAENNEKKFLNRELTPKDISEMDVDGDGTVNYDEFLSFMLVTMGKVERQDIDQLKELYRKLDRDNDQILSIHDLLIKARSRSQYTEKARHPETNFVLKAVDSISDAVHFIRPVV